MDFLRDGRELPPKTNKFAHHHYTLPMNQTLCVILGSAALLLVACATAPLTPFPATHPASPEAQEAPIGPFRNSLVSDNATKKSNDLLAAAEKGTPTPPPAQSSDMHEMPSMKMGGSHENH